MTMSNTAFETIKPYLDNISSAYGATISGETIDAFKEFFETAHRFDISKAVNYISHFDGIEIFTELLYDSFKTYYKKYFKIIAELERQHYLIKQSEEKYE